MTEAHMRPDTTSAERSAGSSRRNDIAGEGERRSFREQGGAGAFARAGVEAFDEARRELERMGQRAGYWGPNLLSRQFDPFLRMQTDMIRWFDQVWREAGTAWQPLQRLGALSAAPMFGLPPADVKETDGAYKLSVELPGLTRQDVELTLENDVLVISGHKQEDHQEARAAYRLSERRFGRFERAFPLPPDVRPEGIAAAFHDGVLTITLPKHGGHAQDAKRAHIEIKG